MNTHTKVWSAVVAVGVLSGAMGIVPQLASTRDWMVQWWRALDAVELPGTYPGEIWKPARQEQFSWLAHEWCYPSLKGFRSKFKVENNVLYRQNFGNQPSPFQTKWVTVNTYISNRGLIRLWYVDERWSGNYVDFEITQPFEWRESERSQGDDGTVTAGHKRLVLSCTRCRTSRDGITYSCDER